MKVDAILRPRANPHHRSAEPPSIRLIWDSDAGTVAGPDAEAITARVAYYARAPYGVSLRLPPDTWRVADPLRNPIEMAILLGYDYTLPPALEAEYPVLVDDTPEGAVN